MLFINEFLHLAFKDIPFNGRVELNTPIYYFTLAFKNLLITIILLKLIIQSNLKDKRASKSLMVGVIGWDLVELYQEYCYIAKVDEKVLWFTDGQWGQIIFIFILIFLTYLFSVNTK